MAVPQVVSAPSARRVPRRPTHTFRLRQKPFTIQPFLLAPVLPGETLTNLLMQASAVSDPIVDPLAGWWLDHYIFYVKHRDLDERDILTAMMLDQSTDVSSLKQITVRHEKLNTFVGGIKWAEFCLKRVVEEYFRDDGEAWDNFTIDGMPVAKINAKEWTDSLMLDAAMPDGSAPSPDNQFQQDAAYAQWQFMMANGLVNMSYEDYLRSFGVRSSAVELHRPELVRFWRNWQNPSNAVDNRAGSTQGVVTSAVRWIVAERADKDRFFTEPGFLFGVSVVRPKIYRTTVAGSAAGALDNAFMWLPALMMENVYTSLKKYDDLTGIIPTATADYWFDVRDLFVHGDQFLNGPLTDTNKNYMALPVAALTNKDYPTDTMVKLLFAEDQGAGTDFHIRQDGICSLTVMGTQRDYT